MALPETLKIRNAETLQLMRFQLFLKRKAAKTRQAVTSLAVYLE